MGLGTYSVVDGRENSLTAAGAVAGHGRGRAVWGVGVVDMLLYRF
jgi:hypothetical protein